MRRRGEEGDRQLQGRGVASGDPISISLLLGVLVQFEQCYRRMSSAFKVGVNELVILCICVDGYFV